MFVFFLLIETRFLRFILAVWQFKLSFSLTAKLMLSKIAFCTNTRSSNKLLKNPQMATHRPSNQDRAAYRMKCRKKLSEHLCKIRRTKDGQNLLMIPVFKLGLSIEPADVRLITNADDPYTWQALPEKQLLFKKQLSKHSIGAYRELCREVGVSFEAVPTTLSNANASTKPDKASLDVFSNASK